MNSKEIEAKAARYNRVEREADEWGRLIGVRRLKPHEEQLVIELTPALDGFEKITAEGGNEVLITKRAPFIVACMVCEVDNIPFTFPKTRGELNAVYDRLDREGRDAAMRAYVRLEMEDKGPDTATHAQVVDEAKN